MAHPREVGWAHAAMVLGLVALWSCEKNAEPGNRAPRQWPSAIAECDPAGYIRCIPSDDEMRISCGLSSS